MPETTIPWRSEELSPIRDKVYDYLKQAILQGVYQSGDRIVERDLADQLQVSRTPIREALFRLESHGFVKTLPRKGVVVSKLSAEEIVEIFTILSSMEGLVMKLAAQRADASQRNELNELIKTIDEALKQPGDLEEPKTGFHFEVNEIVCRASASPRLVQMLDGLSEYIRSFVLLGYDLPGRRRQAAEEHRAIAAAVREGEADKAEKLTQEHLENSKIAYLEAASAPPAEKG